MDENKKVIENENIETKTEKENTDKKEKIKAKTVYSKADTIFAILSMVPALLFTLFGKYYEGFVATISFLTLIACQVLYLRFSGIKLTKRKIITIAFCVLLSFGYCFTQSYWPIFFNTVFLWISLIYSYHYCADNVSDFAGVDMYFDLLRAIIVVPMANFGRIWCAVFNGKKDGKLRVNIGGIVCGLLIAIIPVTAVLLFLSTDYVFSEFFDTIFEWFFDLDINFGDIFIFVLSAMYFYGIIYGGVKNNFSQRMNSESNEKTRQALRFLPVATSLTVEISLLAVYVLYFISQSAYFLNAFLNVLPENYSYAEYARSGFWGLCIVVFINLFVLNVEKIFTVRKDNKVSKTVRTVRLIFCIFTDFLVIISISKMLMYIAEYGLTHDRAVTIWIMLVMFAVFTIFGINQILPKFKANRAIVISCALMVALLTFCNLDSIIVKYNVTQYQKGNLEEFDAFYLEHYCDDESLIYAIPLLEDSNYIVRIEYIFEERLEDMQRQENYKRTLGSIIAENKMKNALK